MVQVYKVTVLLLLVLVLQCFARNCSKDEVCVPVRYCPHVQDAIQSEAVYRNRTWNEYRWCHQSGQELRVCCDQESTSAGKRCLTAAGQPQQGRCVDPEHCGIAGRFLTKSLQLDASFASEKNVCYHSDADGKDYYCCPDPYVNELQKDQTPTKREKRSSKVENEYPSCSRTDGSTGYCVPMRLCDRFGAKVLDREPNFKYEQLPHHYRCPSDASDSTAFCCPHRDPPHDFIRFAKARKLDPENCGMIGTPDRVLGGDEAGLGEFPWMANLMGFRQFIKISVCGGTLIHARYVLTAAHCVKFAEPVSVRLGEHDLSKEEDCVENDCTKYMEYGIASWTSHENFQNKTGEYDIALVKLSEPAEIIIDRVYPICLPITNEWLMMKPSKLIVSGWGGMENRWRSDVLRHATLQTLKDRPYYCKQEQMICARGVNGETNCKGDSGGPLQQIVRYKHQYRMVQFGVISAGIRFCNVYDKKAGVSVSVGYHIKWILDNMEI
ncbi:serine protease grass [Aedes albopictus]|uniref:Peptidase S1 domain-containing protein n=1 Tax=Aedes albopictus TaxID=7160 RepID=A0ABM1YJ53_AEDAL|nr:serine protease grass-like [Aedes albopictus]